MFQKITALAWKDTIIRFSSRTELLFFLILPLVFTVLLSGGVGGSLVGDGDNRIVLLVVNQDNSEPANTLLADLTASEVVRIAEHALAEAEAKFADEDAPALLVIPAGFGAAVLAGETAVLDLRQLPNNTNASAADRAVQTAVSRISQSWLAARTSLAEAERLEPLADEAARQAYLRQATTLAESQLAAAPPRMVVTQPDAALTQANSYNQAAHQSAGQLITWVFIPLLGTSALLAFERRYGTLRRLMVTPTRKATYLLGMITGQYLTAVVQMALLVGFGILIMGVNWGRSPVGLIVMLLTFGLAAVAFGLMMGAFVKTEGQANNLSIMMGMTMALLGGCWFPIELFPPAVRTAVHVLPTTWAMRGLTDLVLRGGGLNDILPEAAVLSGFAVLFFIVGVTRFRYE
ncbi:MAG: ABC transporter permease [Chloroflexi bacterium]|nr:ABC transporter permease [Chloroflexota bacterium]